jgi:hypothetical protein
MTPDKQTTQVEEPPVPPEELGLSRDATHSTYAQVDPPEDVTPPPGPMVEQTLGKPSEAKK